MALCEVLKQHTVHQKINSIMKPLLPIIRRADPMLPSLMQSAIAKVALGSLKTADMSSASQSAQDLTQPTSDASQSSQDIPQVTVDAPQTPATSAESAFTKIGTTVTAKATDTKSALTKALVAAHPDLADTLPGLVDRGMKVGNDAFSNATKFGLPTLLGDDLEASYHEQNTESAVPVPGLAQRVLLAEAALQVVSGLPIDLVESLEVPDIGPTLDAFKTATEGQDEATPASTDAQKATAGAAIVGAAAASVSSVAISASAYLTHKDKKKDQEQKEIDQRQKDREDYRGLVRDNNDDHDKGRPATWPLVQQRGPNGEVHIPDTDPEHPGSPNHPNQGGLGRPPSRRGNASPSGGPPPGGPPGG